MASSTGRKVCTLAQTRLLEVAAREFGLKGLEGASTRAIAAAAGTVMSSITYYYGGKEGLYLAAADYIVEQMTIEMMPVLGEDQEGACDTPSGARAVIHRIMAKFVDKTIGDVSAAWVTFLIREQMNPTAAFDRIHAGVMGQILERVAALIGTATGMSNRSHANIAAATVVGQVMVLRTARSSTLRLLDRATFDAETVADLRAGIRFNTDAILDAMIAERRGQSERQSAQSGTATH